MSFEGISAGLDVSRDHTCPTCHGTGIDHGHTCETCHGTGLVK